MKDEQELRELSHLCRTEPEWAMSRIQFLTAQLSKAKEALKQIAVAEGAETGWRTEVLGGYLMSKARAALKELE